MRSFSHIYGSLVHQGAVQMYISLYVTSQTEGKAPATRKALDQIPQFTLQTRQIWGDRRHTVSTFTLFRYLNILGDFSVTILFSWSWTQNNSLALFATVFALPQRWPQPIYLPRIAHHDLHLYVATASLFRDIILCPQNIFYEGAGIV